MEWFIKVYKQFADFSGRARRKEYWMFILIYLVIGFGLNLLDLAVSGGERGSIFGTIALLFGTISLLPNLAASIRRLHDTGRSGGWIAITMIPIIGWLIFLYFLAEDSEPGSNQWGPNPKGVAAIDT